MSMLTTWSPFRELETLQNRINTLFGPRLWRTEANGQTEQIMEWSPAEISREVDRYSRFVAREFGGATSCI